MHPSPPSGPPPGSGGQLDWAPGHPRHGLDDRIELALANAGRHVAVRDRHRPEAPGLLFSREDWQAITGHPDHVLDLDAPTLPTVAAALS